MPATISPMLARRSGGGRFAEQAMPRIAVPTAPIPVQTA